MRECTCARMEASRRPPLALPQVDLAASNGGNIATTVKDQTIVTPNGVTCIGHTDLNSRVASVSSTLYARNLQKFLLSVGPMTTKTKGAR